MATIGLKVQDSGLGDSFSLADTLAKAAFGDPEGQMKARLMASQLVGHEAYAKKLAADTGLVNIKTREEQAYADSLDKAANAGPLVANAAVPDPVPVEAPRATAPGTTGYGPQPGIVDPQVQRMHDAIINQNNATWPAIVRGTNGLQLVEAGGKLAGNSTLETGLVPGSRPDPNTLRIAGGLSTGSAPTTSTVWSPGDTAGVDAKAREDIAVEKAKAALPIAPHSVTYNGQPGIVRLDAQGNPVYTGAAGTTQTPEKPDVIDLPNGGKGVVSRDATGKVIVTPLSGAEPGPPKPVSIGADAMIPQPDGTFKTPVTDRPAPAAGTPFSDSKATEGIALDIVLKTSNRVAAGQIIGDDEARAYSVAYNQLYGPKIEQKLDINGLLRNVLTPGTPPPPNIYSPDRLRGGAALPAPQGAAPAPQGAAPAGVPAPTGAAPPLPVQAPPAPAVGASGDLGQVFPGDKPKPKQATDGQAKDQAFAGSLANATRVLDNFDPKQLPGAIGEGIVMPSKELGGLMGVAQRFAEQHASGPLKDFGSAANLWVSSQLYKLSGAAISEPEFGRAMRGYLPRRGDPPELLAEKTQRRHDFLNAVINNAYASDPEAKAAFIQQTMERGLQLDGLPEGGGGQAGGGQAGGGPPAMPEGLSERGKELWRKKYGSK